MKESYEQGLTSHSASTPTPGTATSQVLHGQEVHAGQPLSSEINTSRVPTLSNCGEGHIRRDATGESRRNAAESKTLCMRGNSRRENREIPPVSPSVGDRERSEKTSGRTSDMYADGKSDDPIVPTKGTNKVGTPGAESPEERGSPKRNVVQPNLDPNTVSDLTSL